MRIAWICALAALVTASCSSTRPTPDNVDSGSGSKSRRDSSSSVTQDPEVTPIDKPSGRIAAVNTVSRFVVIDFYLSPLPSIGERMDVYRDGFKVGEIKITGPEQFSNIAADLLAGDARKGDEIRTQ